MRFSDLFGLDGAVAALRRALRSDQLTGSYLFVGSPSVGKTSLALAFAQAATCLDPQPGPFDACGRCHSCVRANAGRHPEIVLIPPAGDLTQIWQFWDRDGKPSGALSRTLSYAPTVGKRRVYIVERADTLNEAAANSLLKVLEEPPAYALFILLSPQLARLLPTIISRCQLIRVAPAPVAPLVDFVAMRTAVSRDRATVCAAYSEGRTGMALRLAAEPATETEISRAMDLTVALGSGDPLGALRLGEEIRKLGGSLRVIAAEETGKSSAPSEPPAEDGPAAPRERAGRKQIGAAIDMLIAGYRDLLAISVSGKSARIVHTERRSDLERAAYGTSPEKWMAGLEALLMARRRLDQNTSVSILTDWLAMQLVHSATP